MQESRLLLHESSTSERSSQPEDSPLMAASWILPEVSTSTGVDTGAMPTTDLEQAAWDASVMPVSTGTDTDGNSRAVVSVTGDNSDGPTSTGVGTDGTTSTRAIVLGQGIPLRPAMTIQRVQPGRVDKAAQTTSQVLGVQTSILSTSFQVMLQ